MTTIWKGGRRLGNYKHKKCGTELDDRNYCTTCKLIITGTPRPAIHCKICKKSYIDPCIYHSGVKDSWVLDYG